MLLVAVIRFCYNDNRGVLVPIGLSTSGDCDRATARADVDVGCVHI